MGVATDIIACPTVVYVTIRVSLTTRIGGTVFITRITIGHLAGTAGTSFI